jgi:hypothetical protein
LRHPGESVSDAFVRPTELKVSEFLAVVCAPSPARLPFTSGWPAAI